MLRVLITRPIPEAGIAPLRAAGATITTVQSRPHTPVPREELLDRVRSADVLISLLTEAVDEEVLEAGHRLRGVANYAVGFDNVDLAAAGRLGIPVTNTPGVLTESTADLTWALLLAVARRIPEADRFTREGRFRTWDPELLVGADVGPGASGRKRILGIVGFGRIGRAVARRAAGFDMEVWVARRGPGPAREIVEPGIEVPRVPVDDLFESSDFISLHAPLTPETRHLVDADRLRRMKPSAFLINTARGPLVDERALVQALGEGWIAGAALDVFEDEPRLAEGLRELENVVLAPHIGSASRETRDRMAVIAGTNALHHLKGEPAPNAVNPEVYTSEAWLARLSRMLGSVTPPRSPGTEGRDEGRTSPTAPPAILGERRLRRDADAILRAALEAVDPGRLVAEALASSEKEGGAPSPAPRGGRARLSPAAPALLSVGKAALSMARAALARFPPDHFGEILVVAPEGSGEGGSLPAQARLLRAGHPLPTPGGVRASREVVAFLEGSGRRSCVRVLLSGGTSALLSWPDGELGLEDLRSVTDQLLRAGASIRELNTVRKHLERTKGGRLARAASAPIRGLLISDVIGDDPALIGSGPFSPDPTTYGEALEVVTARVPGNDLPGAVLRHLIEGARGRRQETPKPGDPCFDTVDLRVIGSVSTAVEGARAAATRLGYRTHVLSLALAGEARDVGRRLGALARALAEGRSPGDPLLCLITGGETTVTVSGSGRGGRNQELTLAAGVEISGIPNLLVASLGTDGVDGPTEAAGALATGSTLARARAQGLDPLQALRENDSHPFFRSLGDLVVTGPTGTNVMDVQIVLQG